jgi:alkyl hydroperoxide reductase subunit F
LVFKTYYSQSCHNCPEVVQALNLLASINPNISHIAIDGGAFQAEVEELGIMGVPAVFLDGHLFSSGRSDLNTLLSLLESSQLAIAPVAPVQRAPYDVLVIGAGPAGAAAAVYAARKGIRVGIVADRFGGQTLDTLGIENFISVLHTQGPKFSADLESHVRSYGVDVISPRQAISRSPNPTQPNHHDVTLDSGEVITTKTMILALGARWRNMNIPGEGIYKNKGVAYCPHCDGPLFKGKSVAVIGGGNSGVEAAIDLAGGCSHVTLFEFAGQLRADAVLQDKLRSLPNVTIILNAKTTEVKGDGQKVTGLAYEDMLTKETHHFPLSGIFVQIGLAPNTEWTKPFVNLSPRGEIIVNDHRATSTPGIFAAGDATTVPYKQIIIATGDGATAALSAFDYLMRH